MTTDIPNYLTAEQERVINDMQRVARAIMPEGCDYIRFGFYQSFSCAVINCNGSLIVGEHVKDGADFSVSLNSAIHKIKSPAEQARIDYDRAAKAFEDAKAKLVESEA